MYRWKELSVLLLSLIVVFYGCLSDKASETEDLFPGIDEVLILGHKGSGTKGSYGNFAFVDNSINAVKNGLTHLHGVEIDLQMSKDSTVWLFHDHQILNCEGEAINFSHLSDQLIDEINNNCYNNQLIRLEQLLNQLKEFSNKYISLDLKVLQNPVMISRYGSKEGLANLVAKELAVINSHHHLNFIVEVPFEEQLPFFTALNSSIHLLCNSIQDCRSNLFAEGASCSSADVFKRDTSFLRQLPFKSSQLWVINDAFSLQKALLYSPTFIQTDNIPLVEHARKKQFTRVDFFSKTETAIENEYTMLFEKKSTNEPLFIRINLESPNNFSREDLSLVYTVSAADSVLLWKEFEVVKGKNNVFELVAPALFTKDHLSPLHTKFYIWNKSKKAARIHNLEIVTYK